MASCDGNTVANDGKCFYLISLLFIAEIDPYSFEFIIFNCSCTI